MELSKAESAATAADLLDKVLAAKDLAVARKTLVAQILLAVAALNALLVPVSIEDRVEVLVEDGPIAAGAGRDGLAVAVRVHETELLGRAQLLGRTGGACGGSVGSSESSLGGLGLACLLCSGHDALSIITTNRKRIVR